MARRPRHVRIRSYNVGFGDCFLLTFTYTDDSARNVLLDFGSTKGASAAPKGGMVRIAEQIREDCGGKLNMVVATHRHADHISGFAGEPGRIIASLKPDVVLQPWTEDPDLAPDARAPADARPDGGPALVARLANMQAVAQAIVAQVPSLRESPYVRKTVREQLAFLGETNLANDEAVRHLMTMGRRDPVYASFGTKLSLARVLPGVRVDVLGPPTLRQSGAIARQRSSDADEFWLLAAESAHATIEAGGTPAPLFPDAALDPEDIPQEARWVIPEIERMRSEEMLGLVRILDRVLNNTSLILLLEAQGTRLLFPGDAQIENWEFALGHADVVERLKDARFLKVGHHGSRNATPKSLWNVLAHRGAAGTPDRLQTMVSTLAGKHGSRTRGTEVPRTALIDALKADSDLRDTETIRSRTRFWHDTELDL